jgi:endonuclease YncB( thermonuclease family)
VRLLPVLIAAAGLVGTVVVVGVTAVQMRALESSPADPAREIRESAPAAPAAAPTAPAIQQGATPARAPEPEAVPVAPQAKQPLAPPRPVAPSIVAIPPVDPQALERIEPRPPLSEIAQAAPPKKPPPKPLLFQPVAEAAGIVVAGGRKITIAGIEPIPDAEMCERQGGGTWPCGRAARSAFRAFLRGRAVTCDFPEGEVPDRLSTTCRLGPRDIGAWLAENGWGRADGATYATQAKAAEDARRGIFGPGPSSLPALSGLDAAPSADLPSGAAGPADISILPPAGEPPAQSGATGEPPAQPAATSEPLPSLSSSETFPGPSAGSGVSDPLPPPVSPPARPVPQ